MFGKPILAALIMGMLTTLPDRAMGTGLVNGGFEKVDSSGKLIGWKALSHLDQNRYVLPDLKENFNDIAPTRGRGGAGASAHCAGFPESGTWTGRVSEHFRANGVEGADGSRLGKAALAQTVVLDPGEYVFGAELRSAGGAAYTACFSLGYRIGGGDRYANDGSTGIVWTRNDLGLNTSFDGTGDMLKRGEWIRFDTAPFKMKKRGPVTVWIRFNYVNNGPMPARWQVDNASIGKPAKKAAAPLLKTAPVAGGPLLFPAPGQMVADCGDDERGYLSSDSGSTIGASPPRRMYQHVRCATGNASFTYTFPVNPTRKSVYLAYEHLGPCRITVSDSFVKSDLAASEAEIYPKQYLLTDKALWKDGKLRVRFDCPVPGKTASLVWVEAGSTTRFRERLKNVEWDTTAITWQVGLWDSSAREFRGDGQDYRAGASDYSDLSSRKIRVNWSQRLKAGRRYYLLLGYIKPPNLDADAFAYVNVGDDEAVEWVSKTRGEEILDVDITDYLKDGRNMVSVSADAIDFAALVEVTPGITDNRKLGLYVAGNADAANLTRVYHNTLFWLLSLHYDDSGFIDASVPHGKWWQQYWPIDISFAMRALLHWGYLDQSEKIARLVAKELWSGNESNRSGGSDNNGGNILATEMCELIRRRDFDRDLTANLWPSISTHCDKICNEAESSPFGLIKGTNWENAGNLTQGPCYALTTNLSAAWLLQKAADTAEEGRLKSDAKRWRDCARSIRQQALARLVFKEDVKSPTGWIFPKGTWSYGLLDNGAFMLQPLAGYLWAGMQSSSYSGFIDNDHAIRRIYERTIDAAVPAFSRGQENLISGYAVSYDSGGVVLATAALSDRLDVMDKMIPELIKETDFEHDVGQPRAELSRWAYGPPGWEEDTNLVGASAFLDIARYITGVDDILFDNAQVRLVPRLPTSWNECGVNDWTVRYRDGSTDKLTRLSYNYRLLPDQAVLKVKSANRIKGLSVRLGPVSADWKSGAVTVDGKPARHRFEKSGGYGWVWVNLDCDPGWKTISVSR